MTSQTAPLMAFSALALVFSLAVAQPVYAEDAPAAAAQEEAAAAADTKASPDAAKEGKKWDKKPGEKGHKGKRGGFSPLSEEELGKVENMTADERHAYMEEKRKKWQALSEEEKRAEIEKNKAAFEALSPEKQAELKERHQKLREKGRAEMKAKFESMTPEEQEAFKKKMRERFEERGGKWGDAKDKEGFKGGKFKKGEKPAVPAEAGSDTTESTPAAE